MLALCSDLKAANYAQNYSGMIFLKKGVVKRWGQVAYHMSTVQVVYANGIDFINLYYVV